MSIRRIDFFRPTSRKRLKFAVGVIGLLNLTLFDWDVWGCCVGTQFTVAAPQTKYRFD